jgi:protein-tyrosine phosphatase
MTVCTGNICRSPAAALLLREYLGDLATVSSTGTYAMRGHGIPDEMLACLRADGIDGRDHSSSQFTDRAASESDLMIVMAAEHRRFAVAASPAVADRTFLMSEIATAARAGVELAGATAAERLANLPRAVRGFREGLTGRSPADVPDPYGLGQRAYDDSYAMIREAVIDIAKWVRG